MEPQKSYTFDRVVRILLSVGILAGLIWLIGYLSDVLIPFTVALLLAYLTNPAGYPGPEKNSQSGGGGFYQLVWHHCHRYFSGLVRDTHDCR